MGESICSVEGCPGRVVAWGWCDKHYRRVKKYGDPTVLRKPLRTDPEDARAVMIAAGLRPLAPYPGNGHIPWECECLACGAIVMPRYGGVKSGQGGCQSCSMRERGLRERGPNNPAWKQSPGYFAAHYRHRKTLGSATRNPCVDCGETAGHWSYQGGDPGELVEDGMPYSLDPAYYVPRCHSCHARFDKGR